jgi:hypothetical protein
LSRLQGHRKDFMSMKNPLALDGIKPATFWFKSCNLKERSCAFSDIFFVQLHSCTHFIVSRLFHIPPKYCGKMKIFKFVMANYMITMSSKKQITNQKKH